MKKLMALSSKKVITPERIIYDGVVLIEGDKIIGIGKKRRIKYPRKYRNI